MFPQRTRGRSSNGAALPSSGEPVEPVPAEAIKFLREFGGELTSWNLYAIWPDKATNPSDGLDRVVAMSWPVSFPDREKQAAAWIVRNNRLRNVYFALNPAQCRG